MEDEVDVPVELEVLGHVVVDEGEVVPADVLDVLQRRDHEVVHRDHTVPLREQELAQMAAEKAGAAGDH